MKTRINDDYPQESQGIYSDLYRKFQQFFNEILNQNIYITNQELEEQVTGAINYRDARVFLVGFTGIGKTTLINKLFKAAEIKVNNDNVFVPFNLNRQNIQNPGLEQLFTQAIEVAGNLILEADPELLNNEIVSEDGLANFIKLNGSHLLGFDQATSQSSFSKDYLSLEKRIDHLKQNNSKAYFLERLKYILQNTNKINRVFLIIDNIEGDGFETQHKIIDLFMHAYECLCHLHQEEERRYEISLLIAIRPDTLSVIEANNINASSIDSFSARKISIDSPPSLVELFEESLKMYFSDKTKTDSYKDAEKVLKYIAKELHSLVENLLPKLCNFNIRRTYEEYLRILKNRPFFQKDKNPSASFKLEKYDYYVNDAAVLSALAIPTGEVYTDGQDSVIANVFHNNEYTDSDLIIPYLIKWFLHRSDHRHWYTPSSVNDFKDKMNEIFSLKEFDYICDDVLAYMEYRELLRVEKSDKNLIALTPRCIALWNTLEKNSILFNFYREDIARDLSSESAFKYTMNYKNEDIYIDICGIMLHYSALEKKYLKNIFLNDKFPAYCLTFGTSLISSHIYKGFHASFYEQLFRNQAKLSFSLKKLADQLKQSVTELEDYFNSLLSGMNH